MEGGFSYFHFQFTNYHNYFKQTTNRASSGYSHEQYHYSALFEISKFSNFQWVCKQNVELKRRRWLNVTSTYTSINVGTALIVRFWDNGSSLVHFWLTQSPTLRSVSNLPASMLTTLKRIFSTLCTGLHRSELLSYMFGSSPGACKMDIQTVPSWYTFGWKKSQVNFMTGGLRG